MQLPQLQQPLPGQRRRPHPGLGGGRGHRRREPRPALPEAPPAQTRVGVETGRRHPGQTTRLDLAIGPNYPAEQQDWEPPDWPETRGSAEDALPGQALPEPPDWFGAPPDEAPPEPSYWPEPADSFDLPDCFDLPPGHDTTEQLGPASSTAA